MMSMLSNVPKLAIALVVIVSGLLLLRERRADPCPEADPFHDGFAWTGVDVGRPPVSATCLFRGEDGAEHWHSCRAGECRP